MPTLAAKSLPISLQAASLPPLTTAPPLKACRVCCVVPIRNEVEHLPAMLRALAQQVDSHRQPLDPESYEVLLLANNCNDGSGEVARSLGKIYPQLQLHVIEVTLPKSQANVGYARRLVMNEAYRRLSLLGRSRGIIASTDGDTEVSPTWLSSLLKEFDRKVDAVGGRILTRRTAAGENPKATSLYFLRYVAYQYLTAQLEAFLDPLSHDDLPRHHQYFGANLAVSAEMYGRVGGIPEDAPLEEDVALYRRLQQADAKIRHSPHVRVITSARQVGRVNGSSLAHRLRYLSQVSRQGQSIFVESPWLTEARILARNRLRQIWTRLNSENGRDLMKNQILIKVLANRLELAKAYLQQEIESAPTFGLLMESIESYQKQQLDASVWYYKGAEISLANMHLRQRLRSLQQPSAEVSKVWIARTKFRLSLETFKQVQSIPLFSLTD
ncbi:glycosyltransferase family 2 protein [Lusitaniella coriacea LEGE 07157]|uniref:4,4'-diaponeurosporenoate glycosyltransferase n=1 Tax=Lusitaniella coriacea LEGE 07157 TaxID=945747 RepID=A0A8J7E0L0_9CYAN|nr:glycosyltransferase family 2 protein [Lusitaniella coriacea]MBE9118038.1 glycosyltransferase family 2 protein [Lusitaniella coriacea LEGE 07157]